jgi:hypothetical protein
MGNNITISCHESIAGSEKEGIHYEEGILTGETQIDRPLTSRVGLTADVRPKKGPPPMKIRHKDRFIWSSMLIAFGLIVAFSYSVMCGGENETIEDEIDLVLADSPVPPEEPAESGLRVITLNQTARIEVTQIHATIYFFEDYANFTELRQTYYYPFLGMLIFNCSGPNGTIALYMASGWLIESFTYHGQSLIVVGSWTNTAFYKNGSIFSETWGGMENASRAWEIGAWNPTMGILVEHDESIILGDAQLDIIYCISPVPIPEFSDVVIPVLIIAAIFLARARRKT